MAEILHLRCQHCGTPLANGKSAYCQPCNIALMYRAMPILLGMMLTSPAMQPAKASVASGYLRGRKTPYPHLKDIMD